MDSRRLYTGNAEYNVSQYFWFYRIYIYMVHVCKFNLKRCVSSVFIIKKSHNILSMFLFLQTTACICFFFLRQNHSHTMCKKLYFSTLTDVSTGSDMMTGSVERSVNWRVEFTKAVGSSDCCNSALIFKSSSIPGTVTWQQIKPQPENKLRSGLKWYMYKQ